MPTAVRANAAEESGVIPDVGDIDWAAHGMWPADGADADAMLERAQSTAGLRVTCRELPVGREMVIVEEATASAVRLVAWSDATGRARVSRAEAGPPGLWRRLSSDLGDCGDRGSGDTPTR